MSVSEVSKKKKKKKDKVRKKLILPGNLIVAIELTSEVVTVVDRQSARISQKVLDRNWPSGYIVIFQMGSQAGILSAILTTTPVDLINTGRGNVMTEFLSSHISSLAKHEKISFLTGIM